jgi:hypothetical protein
MTDQAPGAPAQTAPVTAIPAQAPTTDLSTLQSQLVEGRIQLQGLQAQWDGLYSQLNSMLKTNPARPGVQQQWADVGVQIATVKGDMARIEARIAQQQGVPVGTTTVPAPPPPPRSINPNLAIPAVTVLLVVLALPVSIAWARRILRGNPRPVPAPPPPDHTMRLDRIENAVEAVAIEVERIAEGQRFVTRILAERPTRATPEESGVGSLSAAPQPLALGAGPIETIRVTERERVRQPIITPH